MEHLWRKLANCSVTNSASRTNLALAESPHDARTVNVPARATFAGRHGSPTGIAATVSAALFVLLIVVNVIRTLHHAMWRDELEIFMIALHSSSPWSLLL